MTVTADKPAPYSPGATILEVIDRRRSRGMPTPISADVLGRAGIAQTLIPRVLQSLQALDLIDAEGNPTPTFEAIRLAPETEYRKRLEEWLKGTYAEVFTFVDPMKDDETRIRDAFRSYHPIGQQSRMVSLFVALCKAAGLIAEKSSRPARAGGTIAPAPRQRTIVKRIVAERFKDSPRHPSALPAPLRGLLEKLPAEGDVWTKEERAKFLATFTAVLDFCFPVGEQRANTEDDEAA
jgi:uncharacterized protein DUF5343